MENTTKLIAFYLPQFHPIPENNLWWGDGFTEWTNVKKAKPNFEGHYQPRKPGELGYYDLRNIEIQQQQIRLARQFGVYGFCFYYYWFSGKRLLERPLNQFLENQDADFRFCLCWANENWTRRWDGLENEILIAQKHAPDDHQKFIRDVAPILKDKRYIRINGKPLLLVYRVSILENPFEVADIWRKECINLGVGEIYLAAVQSFDIRDPRPYGFDAAIEFPPFSIPPVYVDHSSLHITNPNFKGVVQDYRLIASLKMLEPPPDYIRFRTVMPSWDNTARRQNNSLAFINSTPAVYKKWLKAAVQYTKTHLPADSQYVFINAWNEWGEGAYLEPDEQYGLDYLQATREALKLNTEPEKILLTTEEEINNLNYVIESLYKYAMPLVESKRQLEEILTSKSWKLTIQMRKLYHRFVKQSSHR